MNNPEQKTQQLITIKKCQEDQLDLLFEIAIQTYNDTYQYLWVDKGLSYLDSYYKKSDFKKELCHPNIFYFLIYDAGKAIGYFKIKNNAVASYPEALCIEIEKLYLLKNDTAKGIGKIAIDFIISLSNDQCRPILWLKVMESSPAKYFYEKYGFIQSDKTSLDYPEMKEEYRWILTMINKIDNISL